MCIRDRGVAINSGISPITNEAMFTLPEDEVFIGMGVHGEPGVARKKLGTVNELVSFMMDKIFEDKKINSGETVVVLINGMGGSTLMELYSVYNETHNYLREKQISDVSPMIGSFSTTQETSGFSISLLISDEQILNLWRASHEAPNFPKIT